jgi:hypothetical protein
MAKSYLPTTDAGLLNWGQNFSDLVVATPADFGLTVPQATGFQELFNLYQAAYSIAITPSTRTSSAIAAKNAARTKLKDDARLLVSIIQGQKTVTDQQKIDLGITVRDTEPTPVPPPVDPPEMDIMKVTGRTVQIRLHNDNVLQRKKPVGVKGAAVFSWVGDTPPDNLDDWRFEGNTTKTLIDIDFPMTVPAGSKVWLTAFWFNTKAQSGPPCEPDTTYLAGGLSKAA